MSPYIIQLESSPFCGDNVMSVGFTEHLSNFVFPFFIIQAGRSDISWLSPSLCFLPKSWSCCPWEVLFFLLKWQRKLQTSLLLHSQLHVLSCQVRLHIQEVWLLLLCSSSRKNCFVPAQESLQQRVGMLCFCSGVLSYKTGRGKAPSSSWKTVVL